MSNIVAREIPYNKEISPLFPNATPFSIDNFQTKATGSGGSASPIKIDNDAALDNTLSSLMSEYSTDTGKDGEKTTSEKKTEGMLTGTSLNLNLLQGDLFSYGKYDTFKNPIQPFTVSQHGSGGGGVVSYKEGLTNDVSGSSSSSSSTVTTTTSGTTSAGKSQNLLDLEKKLSELTTDYTTQYRLYTDDLLTRSRFLQTNSQYLNKIVRDISYSGTDVSAAFYYVNSFGYTHRYKDNDISSVLLYDKKTCPDISRNESLPSDDKTNPFKFTPASFIDISGSGSAGFSRFADYASYNMVGYTPCLTAKNVKSGSIDPVYAWVDTEGKKHVYEKGIWPDKRHSSCLTSVVGEPIELTAEQYNAIPTASDTPMKADSECFRASVSPTINTKLAEIKKKIDDTVAAIKVENQNILNNAANTTIIQRDKTMAEKWANLDEDILAQIKTLLGNYYYPAVYVFWCFVILISVLMIFKFAFLFVSPGGSGSGSGSGDDASNGGANGGESSGVSLLGVVIMALIVIFAVYYYFSYTYNLNVDITRNDSNSAIPPTPNLNPLPSVLMEPLLISVLHLNATIPPKDPFQLFAVNEPTDVIVTVE